MKASFKIPEQPPLGHSRIGVGLANSFFDGFRASTLSSIIEKGDTVACVSKLLHGFTTSITFSSVSFGRPKTADTTLKASVSLADGF